jgi:transposase-like protein
MKQCYLCLRNLVKNGLSKTKKQQFYCKPCKKSFTEGKDERQLAKQNILKESMAFKSLREIAKNHSVAPSTILKWIKRANLSTNLTFKNDYVIKLNCLESFILKNKRGLQNAVLILGGDVFILDLQD